ncbi:MAG: S41 family peptidase [Tepidisphaeraceae bacterium]
MSKMSRRMGLAVAVVGAGLVGAGIYGPRPLAGAENTPPVAVAQIESQAVDDIHQGHFDQLSDLLGQAAAKANDPAITEMARWATDFDGEEKTLGAQRQTQFEKHVAEVHTLLDHNMRDYAIDALDAAYVRAPDKDAFRKEKWVDDLITAAGNDAKTAEDAQQWLTAMRIYADLTSLDPYEPKWKHMLKDATLRIRLLVMYTPDQFKAIQQAEADHRKAADALLNPTTQPTTEPVADDDNANFKLDWHDAVRGVTFDMLLDSLVIAEHDYYREAPIQNLMNGGIESLRTLVTTPGLENAFPGLGDAQKTKDFLWDLDQASAKVKQITPDNEDNTVHDCLVKLLQDDQSTVNLPEAVFITEFADGSLDTLDPFSSMIWPFDLDDFKQQTQGEFSGVGIEIENDPAGGVRVVSPLEDSPAYRAGIKAGDMIIRIDGKNARGITTKEAVKTITGPPHTNVELSVRSLNGIEHTFTIERQTINAVSVKGYQHLPGGGWNYIVDPQNKIAYIRLTNFTAKSAAEMTEAMDDIKRQGARALIFDLRANPGGLLKAAVDIASKFIADGVVVSTHPDRPTENPPTENDAEPDKQVTDMPLAILVNQYSASASEIVSGALKDHHRAIIVGERTFGKGSVQMLFSLAAQTAFLKLTTSHYYLPSGRCLHREENSTDWGVDPDVKIEMTPEQMEAQMEARKDMEVLHDVNSHDATTQPDLLSVDPQLSGALLVLRLKLAGVQI